MTATTNTKKIILPLADGAVVLAIAAFLALGFPTQALAYVDPSVMTYTIQALAGVAVALSTVIGVVWRRARRKVYKTFNIDENRGKLVEPSVERLDPAQAEEATKRCEEPGSFAEEARRDPDLKYKPDRWWKRILPAALIATFATGTLLVVAPYELVAANGGSLIFRLDDVWVPIALAALVVDIIVFIVLMLFRGRAFKFACALVLAFGICCYVQALFMNFALPSANGDPVKWEEFTTITIESALIWVAVFAIVIVFSLKSSWKMQRVAPLIAAAMIFIQGVGVASLFLDQQDSPEPTKNTEESGATFITMDRLFDLAPANNVVVFVLDAVDLQDMNRLLDEQPEKFAGFEDFTHFNDVSGSMIPTRYGVPFLLTGELPRKDESFQTFFDERFERSSFMKDIDAQGYSIGLYTDTLLNGESGFAEYVENVHPLRDTYTLEAPENTVQVLWKCALYRDMPWLFKPYFWYYTEEINDSAAPQENGSDGSLPYRINDASFYKSLQSRGLQIVDDGSKGAFRLIHMMGSHLPYTLEENGEVTDGQSTLDEQTIGAFHIVEEYLQDMKDLGIYNDSTIIITSDHGIFEWGGPNITRETSPILLVKPANPENPGSPLVRSDVPITHGHFHPTVIQAVGGNWEGYGTPALDEVDNDDLRYFLMTDHDGKLDHHIIEYVIDGPTTDFDNWEKTGFVWDFE